MKNVYVCEIENSIQLDEYDHHAVVGAIPFGVYLFPMKWIAFVKMKGAS